jgi:hypothetical protein
MLVKHSEDFKLEAVRIALSRGLPRAKVQVKALLVRIEADARET